MKDKRRAAKSSLSRGQMKGLKGGIIAILIGLCKPTGTTHDPESL
jgi:hypothetical protein